VMKNAVDGWIQNAQKWGSKYNIPHFIGKFTLFENAESSAFSNSVNFPIKCGMLYFEPHFRAIDPDHIIIIKAIWWWDTLPNPQQKNWENIVYSLHYYQ
jgi:hypothetical protein